MRLAPDMQRYIKADGYIIVSGLLDKQARMVMGAYMTCGFVVDSKISISGWQSSVFRKI